MAKRKGLLWQETPQLAAGVGKVDAGVRAPFGLILNGTIVWAMCSATNRNLPAGSAANPTSEANPDELAVGNGEPVTAVRMPSEPTWNAETVLRSDTAESGKLFANKIVPEG